MNASSSSESAADLTGIIRLVRRICLFREQGDVAAAARLQTDQLVAAIAAFRLWHGPASLTEEKLCAIFVSETDHVREAMALAAAVAPDLAPLIPLTGPDTAAVFPPMRPLGSLKPFPDGPPPIRELLEGMVAAEAPDRPARAAKTR